MKYITYFVTLFAYASIHMMRMSIPFVQLKLMDFFKIDKFQMGLANALLYIVIGISYFWRALYPIQERQSTYLWSMSICNLSFLIIPVLISFNAPITPMFYVCLAGFGFFHTVAWPTLLSLVHAYFLPKRDGCMLGFWSANGDIGNILGFAICTLIMYNLNLPFQACLYATVGFSIIMSLCVYKIRIEPD
jgi:sugar phosphate permease